MRRAIVAKHIEMQRLRLEIKLYQIVNPHMSLLNEWAKLERRNQESVSRLVRKLLCLSVTIPLVEGAKVLISICFSSFDPFLTCAVCHDYLSSYFLSTFLMKV